MIELIIEYFTRYEPNVVLSVMIDLTVGICLFAIATKALTLKHYRPFFSNLARAIEQVGAMLREATTLDTKPSARRRKLGLWAEAGIYCLFSAYLWVAVVAYGAMFLVSDLTGNKALLFALFLAGLLLVAWMYYVSAKKVHLKIVALRSGS